VIGRGRDPDFEEFPWQYRAGDTIIPPSLRVPGMAEATVPCTSCEEAVSVEQLAAIGEPA
jgi:hypothetical protein